ncbi:MAG: COX15/CtaA family protein [Pseudomonadota bacterium]
MSDFPYRRQVAAWLFVCCAMIFCMVVVGGVTRLTHSGLSIVEWQPLVGAIPPLNEAEWQETFEKYQQTPEYKSVNLWMKLDDFKSIFWVEYAHRLLGRSIGLVFLLPFVYFLMRRRIPPALTPQLVTMFVLGGLQGALGWYMVKSGLVSDPRVSQYRLTAHLGTAFLIYSYIFWVALGIWAPRTQQPAPQTTGLRRFAGVVVLLIFGMALLGGLVAGLRAGFAYNTFPLMGGRLIPDGLLELQPVWKNFFENITTVQFNHRMGAWLLMLVIPAFWLTTQRSSLSASARRASHALLAMFAVQIALGIGTLVMVVPVPLAAAHQGGALLLLTMALWVNHELRRA